MDKIPEIVRASLEDPVYRRQNPECVDRTLHALGASASETFRTFYRTYAGAFASTSLGYELLDLCDGGIAGQTAGCREHHGFPDRYLALTELYGGEILLYDAVTDGVFRVDFEGGSEAQLGGRLPPSWTSFGDFLVEYFGNPG